VDVERTLKSKTRDIKCRVVSTGHQSAGVLQDPEHFQVADTKTRVPRPTMHCKRRSRSIVAKYGGGSPHARHQGQ
ncbi:uncharacterized protein PgNI_04273, partial [Pyricularia grisea]|uniref:Uncharacterized protein n=1 Tax=Pyricularia grisea TaxID=148305 RepID=A0A6P8BBJ3_PYRGI